MKLIDKDTLLAEIERLYDEKGTFYAADVLYNLKEWLDTLEVKEVDLEKFTEKINTFQARYKHPEIISIKGAMAFMARMFYQYPNVAREWYESLTKATMD